MAREQQGGWVRPVLNMLSEATIQRVIEEAHALLRDHGIITHNGGALVLAAESGLDVGRDTGRVRIDEPTIERCLASAPSRIVLYDRSGEPAMDLGDCRPHFNPGSAAITILDPGATRSRAPLAADCVRFARLTGELPHLSGQSTGIVPTDVPREHADWSRLLIGLLYCEKPVVTGTFRRDSLAVMRDLLLAVRGSDQALRAKPLAIMDCCPSPPLRWGDHIIQDLIDAAHWGIPTELISMPAMGSVAPVTIVGSLVQHTAESLSGIVFSQLAAPGAPVIYGGSPSLFDMRVSTTPMGAIESMVLMCSHAQIGRHLGLPTHAYMGLSDSKLIDAQAGAETAMGATLGVLAGVNNMSGPGMLELESCFSLEKLVIDNDLCGTALRLAAGVAVGEDQLPPPEVFGHLIAAGHLLVSDHTLRHCREPFYPEVLDRSRREDWARHGCHGAWERAADRVTELLEARPLRLPDAHTTSELLGIGRSVLGDSAIFRPGV